MREITITKDIEVDLEEFEPEDILQAAGEILGGEPQLLDADSVLDWLKWNDVPKDILDRLAEYIAGPIPGSVELQRWREGLPRVAGQWSWEEPRAA